MPRPTHVPDDLGLPDWVSEPRSSLADNDGARVVRRADRRRSERGPRREESRDPGRGGRRERHEQHGETPTRRRRERPQDGGHREATLPSSEGGSPSTSPNPANGDSLWLTRAERRRRLEAATARRQFAGRRGNTTVEMVPPTPEGGTAARAHRHAAPPGARTSQRTFARRRLGAALALTSALVLVLWSLWSSTTSPERGNADLSASALRQKSDPTPAAEELPTAATTPGAAADKVAPQAGTGKLVSVALPAIAAPQVNPNRTVRVGLQVERGAGVNAAEAAAIVSSTLGDKRGWQTRDEVRFRAVSPTAVAAGDVDITIVLASPKLTDKLCAPLKTRGEVSCFNLRKVVLNVRRWTEGVPGYGTDLAAYRQYMVNHETGHGLYHGHVECPRKGALAPIMLQQSKGLDGCRQNPWPTAG